MLRFNGWLVAAALVLAGCEGTQRESAIALPQAALPGGSAAAPGAAGAAGAAGELGSAGSERTPGDLELTGAALAPGAACSTSAACASGFCVDGVCCQSSCDVVCSRCDTPGAEGACTVAANDTACTLSCPASTDCRSYGSGALTANCEAVGLCRTLAECTATNAPAGTACEGGTGSCDGQGECIVAGKKRLGEACAVDDDCAAGNCVVGSGGAAICCDSECAGLCQACSADGHCNETPPDDARCPTIDCPDDNLCRDYVPDLDVNLCRGFGQCRTPADCTFMELRSGAQCNCGPGGCSLTSGSSCASGTECASGVCEETLDGDQLCCAQSCGQGASCSADGSRCEQCGTDGSTCAGNVSQRCAAGVLTPQTCGNGCNQATGQCNEKRPTGGVCDGNAQCQSGVCATDVSGTQRCCAANCNESGRACGTNGSCVCPAGQTDVGGTCRRNPGQTCAQNGDCVSGACVATVSGARVCCAQGCGGDFCTADGSSCVECEGAQSSCQGTTAARCQNGDLIETTCGNGCNAATGVCNGLLANGQGCTGAAQCASNTCAQDRNGTQRCCTPNCAASGRVCGTDGACVCPDANDVFVNGACRNVEGQACAADGDCRSGACEPTQGGAQVCCSSACNGQICRANGQGCVACEGNASTCQGNNSRSCVNNAFVTTTCANGCNAATGQCNALIARGGTGCSSSAQCAGNGASCQSGRCCEFNCVEAGRTCNSAGICQCPSGTEAQGNACLLPIGSDCTRSADCASGRCDALFEDKDGDNHGDPARPRGLCGAVGTPAPEGFVASSDDCCDESVEIFPGQTRPFATPHVACPNLLPFDYDCDGAERGNDVVAGNCTSVANCSRGWSTLPACGAPGSFRECFVQRVGGTDQCTVVGIGANPLRSCN